VSGERSSAGRKFHTRHHGVNDTRSMDDEMQSEHADRNDGSSHGHVIQFHRLDN